MLVVLSDLHLTDRTSGVQTVDPNTYQAMFETISLRAKQAGSRKVLFLYLGDIFDMIRTTSWARYGPEIRPWTNLEGPHGRPTLDAALEILRGIAGEGGPPPTPHPVHQGAIPNANSGWQVRPNAVIFEMLRNPPLPEGCTFENHYVPGNHDRICNAHKDIRREVRRLLNITPIDDAEFPNEFYAQAPQYEMAARHGHEWDRMSFRGGDRVKERQGWKIDEDYLNPPISELLSLELTSRLPGSVAERIRSERKNPRLADEVERRLSCMEDVRPISAVIPWVLREAQRFDVTPELDSVTKQLAGEVLAHPFYRNYPEKPARVQMMLFLLRRLPVRFALKIFGILGPFAIQKVYREMMEAAERELSRLKYGRSNVRFFLCGHTHAPVHWPIAHRPRRGAMPGIAKCYVNTGTWRPYHRQTIDKNGFFENETLTCTILFHPEEDPRSSAATLGEVTLEQWNWTGPGRDH